MIAFVVTHAASPILIIRASGAGLRASHHNRYKLETKTVFPTSEREIVLQGRRKLPDFSPGKKQIDNLYFNI
jgi:hypothetical protein